MSSVGGDEGPLKLVVTFVRVRADIPPATVSVGGGNPVFPNTGMEAVEPNVYPAKRVVEAQTAKAHRKSQSYELSSSIWFSREKIYVKSFKNFFENLYIN
jgi:hypothetical protein